MTMKNFAFIGIALCAAALVSCSGSSDTHQATAVPTAQEQMATQPQQTPATDSTAMAQPQQATAQTAQGLPEAITAFLQKHFPGATVARVETDNEYGGLEYDLTLNDGTEVDFDASNRCEKVDCKVKAVPAALVPASIASYVKSNYQSLPITKIDIKPYGYEIELSNGLDLNFNNNGQFVSIDD